MARNHRAARYDEYRQVRLAAAELSAGRSYPDHLSNGEEEEYRNAAHELSYVANFSKGLPHNSFGEVNRNAYTALVRALTSGNPDHFELIPLGSVNGRKLTNPQAGLSYDLEGPDPHSLAIRPAPRIDSAENAAEMGELYWMALLRDVHFRDYGTGAATDAGANNTAAAATSMTNDFTDFRGPKDAGAVTADTLFRGSTPGDLVGPYLSQFLLLPVNFGTLVFEQRQKPDPPNVDYLTDFPAWLAVQRGLNVMHPNPGPTVEPLYIRNLRDLATYVHIDALYEAYLNACLILLKLKAPLDPGNPYVHSRTQDGFGTFGGPHILSLVTEVATRALKAVWFQKRLVHRRLRPEAFGGRIEVHRNRAPGRYPMINAEILNSAVVPLVEARWGSALLPQAFAEGSPTHPAYGAGHATVAGACVTILKAWFDESWPLPGPTQQPDKDGKALENLMGVQLTVAGELNKLAANIAIGRNAAGVHWRSDYSESIRLGEEVAIQVLREQKLTYNEDFRLSLTRFDGTAIAI